MKKYTLENGIKLIYERRQSSITSFCIGFEAGALAEDDSEVGIAHGLEHMLFKGTKNYSEEEINTLTDEIFGFSNAMTNYPYVIYYGTCLSEDFTKGFKLYSDIVLNPTFPTKGFHEEMNIIQEELKEWKEDPYQFCEDELFKNAFNNIRIKELIIGNEQAVGKITIPGLEEFYKKKYRPDNCVISIVTSFDFDFIKNEVNKIYSNWKVENREAMNTYNYYENNKPGLFICKSNNNGGAKIQYLFPINNLSEEQIDILKVFSSGFGEGTSSLLYDLIRTKNGLAYDVKSYIKNEKGIKLFCIQLGTSKEEAFNAVDLINSLISEISKSSEIFNEEYIKKIIHNIELKSEIKKERSIELCINLCTSEIMYGDANKLFHKISTKNINEFSIITLLKSLLINPSIQIILPAK